jgi:dUTP pyrophosphatase
MNMNIKKLHPSAIAPTYAHPDDACFDLRAYTLHPSAADTITLGTGLAFEVPKGHVMLVFSRSGHGFNNDVRLANCVGVIDPGYTKEVMVKLRADGDNRPEFKPGDRIAQALVLPVAQQEFTVVDSLPDSPRTGGLGSTGQ